MSAFCNCQKGDSILKLTKRIFSGLLAAMMLFTTAFAVNDSATTKAANALTFAFKPITGSEYDSTALQTDLAAAQKTISQRMQLEGLTGASAAVSGDVITDSMRRAIDETLRRRELQEAYNKEHGITPKTIKKAVRDLISISKEVAKTQKKLEKDMESMSRKELEELIGKVQKQMKAAAADLNFEMAAELRDQMIELKKNLEELDK